MTTAQEETPAGVQSAGVESTPLKGTNMTTIAPTDDSTKAPEVVVLGPDTDWSTLSTLDYEIVLEGRLQMPLEDRKRGELIHNYDGRFGRVVEVMPHGLSVQWDAAALPCSVSWCIGHRYNDADGWADLTHEEEVEHLSDFPDLEQEGTRDFTAQHQMDPFVGHVDYVCLTVEGQFNDAELDALANALDETASKLRARANALASWKATA